MMACEGHLSCMCMQDTKKHRIPVNNSDHDKSLTAISKLESRIVETMAAIVKLDSLIGMEKEVCHVLGFTINTTVLITLGGKLAFVSVIACQLMVEKSSAAAISMDYLC